MLVTFRNIVFVSISVIHIVIKKKIKFDDNLNKKWKSNKKYDIMQLTFYMGSFNKKAIQKKKKKKIWPCNYYM